jgi:hypothetical protein
MRFFGCPLWRVPPLTAAAWVAPMVKQTESWTYRKLNPEWYWTPDNQLLATVIDELRVANWQRSEDGHKNRNHPDPYPRPGAENYVAHGDRPHAVDVDELREILSRPRTAITGRDTVHGL